MNAISELQARIEEAWTRREAADFGHDDERDCVARALAALDCGALRVAEKVDGVWRVHEWLKKAVLLSFRLNESALVPGGATNWYDKVALKCAHWGAAEFAAAGFRSVPGSWIRYGAHVAAGVVVMPSFINIGAYVGAGTMVDTWASVGSCAQVGARCHLSGGVGIGGVLEPLQAQPVIIEDDCFIGARSEVVEGVRVEEGSVLAMGVFLSASTPIIERSTGKVYRGRVPSYSVVVPGVRGAQAGGDVQLACAVIVKRVDAQTRAKTSINALLRD